MRRSVGPTPNDATGALNLLIPRAEAVADRGKLPSLITLALLAALAWAAVILWARSTAMMDAMPGHAAIAGALLFAGMWLMMMAAMMLPAISPVVVLFRTLQRGRGEGGGHAVPTAAFVSGYLAIWTLAGIAADVIYLVAHALGAHMAGGARLMPVVGGLIIVLAGLYQFSPLKNVCLAHCRSPFHIILHGWHEGRLGALRMGASHGAYCLGCCWGIMAVLFVVGLMNLAWMAALSLLIAAEKLAPRGIGAGRLAGVLFIALGLLMAVQPRFFPASGLQVGDAMAGMPIGMSPTSRPSTGTERYTAVAGPYLLTVSVTPQSGMHMATGQERIVIAVVDRAMGMKVSGAHVVVRLAGMDAPHGEIAMKQPAHTGGMAGGTYASRVRLMPGSYRLTVEVNGRIAGLRVQV